MVKPKAKVKHQYSKHSLPQQHPSNTLSNHAPHDSSSDVVDGLSVTARLQQLRLENARNRLNQQREVRRPTQLQDIHPFYNFESGTPLPEIRPPNASQVHEKQNITERIKRRRKVRTGVISLSEICTYTVAYQIIYSDAQEARLARTIPRTPIHLKELLLHAIAELGGVNDRILKMMGVLDLNDLCLENCTLSLDLFYRTFWKLETKYIQPVKESKETWEELDDDELDESATVSSISDKYDDGRFASIYRVTRLINPVIDISKQWNITSKLAHLTSLEISFFRPHFPGLATSELIVTTLPHLTSLSMAGTLQKEDGYGALSVLSKGLRMLQYWDIGYHDWITPEVICGYSSTLVINWDKDLQNLDYLSLEYISSDNDSDASAAMAVKRQFYDDVRRSGRVRRRPIILTSPHQYQNYSQRPFL
ncbi:hypothetical protein BGW37DRAFT_493790 [Umbelopsis sp. PMI_123]|nr:hypothetical protein BGW37DRAFT_493790 [Umbelopsis sp. PMI_123]